jgi:hypothetical protein
MFDGQDSTPDVTLSEGGPTGCRRIGDPAVGNDIVSPAPWWEVNSVEKILQAFPVA